MNPQIEAILNKAQESLGAARLLAEQGYPDFAASRAYYTMFYTAEALLLLKGLSYSSHSAVIAAYGKEFSKTSELDPKFHKYMIAAQDFRSQGDYAYGEGVSTSHANSAIEWASEFLEAAKVFISAVA
jgi:uncharacterized protein (UPF0332 family)